MDFYWGVFSSTFKIIFFDNRVLSLSSVLSLVLILFIYKIYLVLFMLYCLGTQVCADHVSNVFIRFGRFDLKLPVFGLCCCSWSFFCRLGNLSFSKMPNNLAQYRGKFLTAITLSMNLRIKICLCYVILTNLFQITSPFRAVLFLLSFAVFLVSNLDSCKRTK